MRFESATVPAAVMPDRFYDHGFFELPATVPYFRDGKASENRDKSEDLPFKLIFKAFGKKSTGSFIDSLLKFPSRREYWIHVSEELIFDLIPCELCAYIT